MANEVRCAYPPCNKKVVKTYKGQCAHRIHGFDSSGAKCALIGKPSGYASYEVMEGWERTAYKITPPQKSLNSHDFANAAAFVWVCTYCHGWNWLRK